MERKVSAFSGMCCRVQIDRYRKVEWGSPRRVCLDESYLENNHLFKFGVLCRNIFYKNYKIRHLFSLTCVIIWLTYFSRDV